MINIIVSKIEPIARLELNGSQLDIPSLPERLLAIGSGLKVGDVLVVDYAHAELILLRVLRRVREGELSPASVNIMLKVAAEQAAFHMPVSNDGDFIAAWPGGFYSERVDEIF